MSKTESYNLFYMKKKLNEPKEQLAASVADLPKVRAGLASMLSSNKASK